MPELPADAVVTSAYWFCSAVAQAFAALTALTGLFAVYKMQSIRQEKDDIVTRALFEMRRVRDRINSQDGTQVNPIHDELVPAGGEPGWAEIRSAYERDYVPALTSMKRIGGERKTWAEDMERFFDGTFRRHEARTMEENTCRRSAVIFTIADGLVVLISLTLILCIPRLGRATALTMVAVLVLAGVALLLTLYACVYILRGVHTWPSKPRTVGANREAPDSASES
jgi:hypothetical protein